MGQFLTLATAKAYLGKTYDSAYYSAAIPGPDDDRLTADIESVEGLIQGYLQATYAAQEINETETPQAFALLRGIAETLITHRAHSRFDYANLPESVKSAYDDSIFRLRDLASGKLKLPNVMQSPRSGGISYIAGDRARFQASSMRGT